MKHYHGHRCGNDIATISVAELDEHTGLPHLYPLPLYTWLLNKSPTGFEWGYLGSGPGQAAFAILYDHSAGDQDLAQRLHLEFMAAWLARRRQDAWCITEDQIATWLRNRR